MREPRESWVAALRAECGAESYIRWNELVGRWAFGLQNADGVVREQFFGWFTNPQTGERIPADDTTGLPPFRDLDDAAMAEVLGNLQRTFVGNPYDGAGTPRREILRRQQYNKDLRQKKYRELGDNFADRAAERGRRMRGSPLIHVPVVLGAK